MNPELSITKVKGPLLMPKDNIVVIEKERAQKLLGYVNELIHALGWIAGPSGEDTSPHAEFARTTLKNFIRRDADE